MPQLRVEIYSVDHPNAAEVVLGATLEVDGLMTPAAAQPQAPNCYPGAVLFLRAEALQVPTYVAVGRAPNPSQEPRILVLPGRSFDGHTPVRIQAGDSVAAVLADDVEWTR